MKLMMQKYEGWIRMIVVIFTMSSYYFSLKYEVETALKESLKITAKLNEIEHTVNVHQVELAVIKQKLDYKTR